MKSWLTLRKVLYAQENAVLLHEQNNVTSIKHVQNKSVCALIIYNHSHHLKKNTI